MIKVIVFSDIKIYCDGLSSILASTKSIEVIAAENDFDHAVAKIKQDSPDVILLEMTMKDSCQIAHNVKRLFPDAKIIALATPENENNIVECAKVGFTGYVTREASLDELIATIIGAKNGEFCCPPKIAAHIFNNIHHIACVARDKYLPRASLDTDDRITGLTRREQQILKLMARGLSNKLISRDLNIEVSTVKNHVHNILVKLGVKSRTGATSLLHNVSITDDRLNSLDLGLLERVGRHA
ncbi:MAG: LuxR C-terminal-related transcriptional regulator [Gammaproteobacteria bacterium]